MTDISLARRLRPLACILLFWCTHLFAAVSIGTTVPGVATPDPTQLVLAVPIKNSGDTGAKSVVIHDIELRGGRLDTPTHLPVSLGAIGADERKVLDLRFTVAKLEPRKTYKLVIKGEYRGASGKSAPYGQGHDGDDGGRHGGADKHHKKFRLVVDIHLPPPAPGSATTSINHGPTHVTRGPYAPLPQPPERESNEDRAPTPLGTPTFRFPHTVSNTSAQPASAAGAAVGFVINSNSNGIANRFPPDPSAAASGSASNVVLATGNLYMKYSVDGGATFTTINNLSTVFGDQPDGGYCCDQVVHYIPKIDRFVWLIQTNQGSDASGNPTANRLRIAWAKPADIANNFYTAWTWFDVTSGFLGLGNDWLDFPDLSTSDGYLYASVDDVNVNGLVVMRISYRDMQLPGGSTVTWDFTHPGDGTSAVASHLTQNAAGTMYWAGHDDTSNLRVFSWPDGSNQYSWTAPKTHNTYAKTDYTSRAPDGQYWYAPRPSAKPDNITSAIHRPGELWFAWTAGRDTTFAQPYVVIAQLNDSSLDVARELEVWNPDLTFAYPALAVNSATSEVAISLMWGGGGKYFLNHAVGFLGDFVVWITTASDVTFTVDTATGPTACDDASGGAVAGRCTRSGDYLSLRRVGNASGLFGTLGYEIKLVDPTLSTDCVKAPGCRQDVHYIEFGRPQDTGGNGGIVH
jgi:hypothetical protein